MTTRPDIRHAAEFQITYRDITDEDLPFLARVYRSTRESELDRVPWSDAEKQDFIAMQFRAQHVHYQANYPDALWLIIEQDTRAVGRLYIEHWTSEHRIIDIALLPDARGRGIGGAILSDILDQAAHAGKNVGIHVEKTNPAMSLYRRLGFRMVEDQGVYDLLVWSPP